MDGKPRKIELYVERHARQPLSFRSEARNLFLPQHNAASNSRILNGYRRFGMTKQQNPQRLIAVFRNDKLYRRGIAPRLVGQCFDNRRLLCFRLLLPCLP